MISYKKYDSKEEWLELRRKLGIGGSDAGAVIGLNPYKSAYALWAEKTGRVPEFEGNTRTAVGSYLEDFVAREWAAMTGKKVRRNNRIILNDMYPWAFADVDREVVGEKAILEIKTTTSLPIMRKCRNGEFPESWYAQVVHYLAVTGAEKAYLAALVNCSEIKIFELERDEKEIDALMEAEEAFWLDNVKKDAPPAPDGAASSTEALDAVFDAPSDDEVDITPCSTDLATYDALSTQIKALSSQKDELANKIKAYLGNASRGRSDRFKVSWALEERTTFDRKAFAAANPGVDMTPYNKTSSSRVFRVRAI